MGNRWFGLGIVGLVLAILGSWLNDEGLLYAGLGVAIGQFFNGFWKINDDINELSVLINEHSKKVKK